MLDTTESLMSKVQFIAEAGKRGYRFVDSKFDAIKGKLEVDLQSATGWRVTVTARDYASALNALSDKRVKPTLDMISEANAGGPETNGIAVTK